MKKKLIYLLITICCMSLAGCSQGEKPAEQAKTPKIICIGVMPDVESIPFVIAEKNGYFLKEGVQVKLVHFKSAKDRDSALQAGELDGVITDMVAVVFANEGGINIKAISRIDGNIQLLAGKASGIKAMSDLKGKDIGISSNTVMEYSLDRMLQAAGMQAGDVQKIAIPQLPTRLEMLQGEKIAAAILPQPLSDLAVKNGATILNSTDAMKNKAGVTAFTSKSLKENPEEIKAIFKAYNEAVVYMKTEPVANYVDFVIEAQGFPAEVKGSFALPQYQMATAPDEKILTDVIDWMKSKELVKSSYGYADLVDEQILR